VPICQLPDGSISTFRVYVPTRGSVRHESVTLLAAYRPIYVQGSYSVSHVRNQIVRHFLETTDNPAESESILERRLQEVADLAAENFEILKTQLADVARRLPPEADQDRKEEGLPS
jgi:hypothetical protein